MNNSIKAVYNLFRNARVPTTVMFHYSKEFNRLTDYCDKNKIRYFFGCTKIAFLDLVPNKVIKIPLAGEYNRWSLRNNHSPWIRYEVMNHLEKEVEDYRDTIKGSEVEDLFVPIIYEGRLNELEIYSQEYITPICERRLSISDEEFDRASETYFSATGEDNEEVICAFWAHFGGECEGNRVLEMIDDLGIKDLHGGNLGWDENNNLKIFDYAGFWH